MPVRKTQQCQMNPNVLLVTWYVQGQAKTTESGEKKKGLLPEEKPHIPLSFQRKNPFVTNPG